MVVCGTNGIPTPSDIQRMIMFDVICKCRTPSRSCRPNISGTYNGCLNIQKLQIEENFNNNSNNNCHTGGVARHPVHYNYKKGSSLQPAPTSLTKELINFFARFDKDNNEPRFSVSMPEGSQALTLHMH